MESLNELIHNLINMFGIYGPIFSCILILFESIIPIMPLALFITINFLAYGKIVGFIISWIFTVLGCIMSFYLFRKGVQGWFQRLTKDRNRLNNLIIKFNNISFVELAVIIAIPFTPAFIINIAAGLSNISKKKYICALLVGKLGLVYFWGYIGTSLVESLTHPVILIKIIIIMLITYIISTILKKVMKF